MLKAIKGHGPPVRDKNRARYWIGRGDCRLPIEAPDPFKKKWHLGLRVLTLFRWRSVLEND
jgi:hypothetical protein